MIQERYIFTDEQWQRIEPSMPPCKGRLGGAHRAFFDALLWMTRTGATCPSGWAHWRVVYQRYPYWCEKDENSHCL